MVVMNIIIIIIIMVPSLDGAGTWEAAAEAEEEGLLISQSLEGSGRGGRKVRHV